MVRSINEIGHVMGISTIAEYVENDMIAAKVCEIGVDFLQGYAISEPLPIDDYLQQRPHASRTTQISLDGKP